MMKIGDLAKESGLTERMLRHYEGLGIIVPSRSSKGTRHYSCQDVEIARLTHLLRELDVSLDTISAIAVERRAHSTGDASGTAVGALLEKLAQHLAEKAEKSLALHRVICEASRVVRNCRGCENEPGPSTCPDCPMNEAVEGNAVAAMIWQERE